MRTQVLDSVELGAAQSRHETWGDSTLTIPGGVKTALRYYTEGGATIAVRSAAALSYLGHDLQDTDTIAVNSSTFAASRRFYTPYGATRSVSGTFPTTRGFIDKTLDLTTSLIQDGARFYNPGTATFVNPDPLATPGDDGGNSADAPKPSTELTTNAYSYAAGNPTSLNDPTGLKTYSPSDGGSGCFDKACNKAVKKEVHSYEGCEAGKCPQKGRSIWNRAVAGVSHAADSVVSFTGDAVKNGIGTVDTWVGSAGAALSGIRIVGEVGKQLSDALRHSVSRIGVAVSFVSDLVGNGYSALHSAVDTLGSVAGGFAGATFGGAIGTALLTVVCTECELVAALVTGVSALGGAAAGHDIASDIYESTTGDE